MKGIKENKKKRRRNGKEQKKVKKSEKEPAKFKEKDTNSINEKPIKIKNRIQLVLSMKQNIRNKIREKQKQTFDYKPEEKPTKGRKKNIRNKKQKQRKNKEKEKE